MYEIRVGEQANPWSAPPIIGPLPRLDEACIQPYADVLRDGSHYPWDRPGVTASDGTVRLVLPDPTDPFIGWSAPWALTEIRPPAGVWMGDDMMDDGEALAPCEWSDCGGQAVADMLGPLDWMGSCDHSGICQDCLDTFLADHDQQAIARIDVRTARLLWSALEEGFYREHPPLVPLRVTVALADGTPVRLTWGSYETSERSIRDTLQRRGDLDDMPGAVVTVHTPDGGSYVLESEG